LARYQAWVEPAGDPETDDAPAPANDGALKRSAQHAPVIAAHDRDAETCGDPCLERKPGYRDDRPKARQSTHMPSKGRLLLRIFMLRKRPNAHNGKNRA
jgi:hypothetical protein